MFLYSKGCISINTNARILIYSYSWRCSDTHSQYRVILYDSGLEYFDALINRWQEMTAIGTYFFTRLMLVKAKKPANNAPGKYICFKWYLHHARAVGMSASASVAITNQGKGAVHCKHTKIYFSIKQQSKLAGMRALSTEPWDMHFRLIRL